MNNQIEQYPICEEQIKEFYEDQIEKYLINEKSK